MVVHSLCWDLRALEYAGGMSRVRESGTWDKAMPRLQQSRASARRRVFSNATFARRLCFSRVLEGAEGCVNTCSWSSDGSLLVASGDDTHAQVWHGPHFEERARVATGHVRNVFAATFAPESAGATIATAAMDGAVHLVEVEQSQWRVLHAEPGEFAMKLAFVPHCPAVLVSTHGGGVVNMVDIRSGEEATPLLHMGKQALGISFDPLHPTHFALGVEDHLVRLFDIRSFGAGPEPQPLRSFSTEDLLEQYGPPSSGRLRGRGMITASDVTFSSKGELLVNYSSHDLVLFDSHSPPKESDAQFGDSVSTNVLRSFSGRTNAATFLKEANFMLSDEYVVTGGDSGCVYAWEKRSGKLLLASPADNTILNGVSPHPYLPLLATCGIDSNVKIFDVGLEANEVDWSEEVAEIDRVDKVYGEVRSRTGNRFLDRMFASMYEVDTGPGVITHQECLQQYQALVAKKEKGNAHFKAKEFQRALALYKEATDGLGLHPTSQRLYAGMLCLYRACLLNSAACYAKLENWKQCAEMCMRVLQGDRNNVKALYRIAECKLRMGDLQAAQNYLDVVADRVPNDPNVVRLRLELASLADNEEGHSDGSERDEADGGDADSED